MLLSVMQKINDKSIMKKLKWVYGNTLPLALKLYELTIVRGGYHKTPYIAPEGSVYTVKLVGAKVVTYDCTVEGNVVTFTDTGTLPCGKYGVEVDVVEPSRNLRTFKFRQVEIVYSSDELNVGDMISADAVALDSDTFFWAKGDPLTYDDLTEEQKDDLRQGCYQKVSNIDISEENGLTQMKGVETFPVAHPDISSNIQLMPYTWNGYKVYEQVFVSDDEPDWAECRLKSSKCYPIEAHALRVGPDARFIPVKMKRLLNNVWVAQNATTDSHYDLKEGDYVIVRFAELVD